MIWDDHRLDKEVFPATTVLTAEIEESIPVDVSEGLVDYLKVGFSEVNGSEGLTLE